MIEEQESNVDNDMFEKFENFFKLIKNDDALGIINFIETPSNEVWNIQDQNSFTSKNPNFIF